MIVDPLGRIIAERGENKQVVSVEIDPNPVDSVRAEYGFFNDRVL